MGVIPYRGGCRVEKVLYNSGKGKRKMIYWATANRVGDRYTVYFNGKVYADYLTLDECFSIVMELKK